MSSVVLPEGWANAEVGDYIHLKNGFAFKSNSYVTANEKTVPVIRISDLNGTVASDITAAHVLIDDAAHGFEIRQNDLLIAMSGATTGKVGVYRGREPAYQNQRVGNLRLNSTQYGCARYRDYLISSLSDEILKLAYGGAQPNISGKAIETIAILVPPLAEQKVIAAKLDELLAQVDILKTRLTTIPKLLKRFRQSVLAAAVSGKLTEEWRLSNKTSLVNLQEISNQHEASQKRKGVKNYKAPEDFDQKAQHYELPDIWRWFRAEQLCDLITKGTTPSKEKMNSFGDVPYIKVYNLTFDGTLDFTIDPTFVPQSVHERELARSKVFAGDVLMNIVGPPLGKVSIVPATYKEWNINQAISIFRPVCGVTNKYLSICLRNEFLLDLTKAKAKATAGQFNLTLEICRDYSVPVPPLEEQTEIVRRVEQLFAFADQIEQQVKNAQSRVNNLTQSILAKAFRGELTAEWRAANPYLITGENSAQALLAKIKAERDKPKKTLKLWE